MRVVHFYHLQTGELSRFVYRTNSPRADEHIAANTPPGYQAIEGVTDRDAQRVDIGTGRLISDPALKQRNVDRKLAWRKKRQARHEIEELEKLQVRSISELLQNPSDSIARGHFERRRKRIEQLRNDLTAGTETSGRAG
jgi:hypothetical protein